MIMGEVLWFDPAGRALLWMVTKSISHHLSETLVSDDFHRNNNKLMVSTMVSKQGSLQDIFCPFETWPFPPK